MELIKPLKINGQSKDVILLDSFRIKATDNLPPNVYVSKIGNTNKFSKGNISAWTGKAKSKKTFAITMLVSSMVAGSDLYGQFNSYNQNKVLWIDTEQSPHDVQKVAKRVKELVGSEDNLFMYGLRPLSPKQRVEQIEKALAIHECDVLVIDGVRDLIMSINDAAESTEIVTKLMKWSYDYNIHVTTVIHQSSADKVRGHIGTEIENKAETVIKVVRDEHDVNVSYIKEMYGRGKGFEDFQFYIDDNGLPVIGGIDFGSSFKSDSDNEAPF
tara:strand:+ start:647 stop:1459 length:813 start_codon:yes stop_codon:yes gene_type:complete